ncbi:hypothetical protein GCM10022393_29390 [Aquimarina addita]|uniref:Periplasmic copper-binding protein NosD beta helix domain-containing protein n=1 Tax=Aquimarina addita TaxID=870485 RepID=A0ABP6UNP7_9FLAO
MKKLIYSFLFCSLFFVSCSTDEGVVNEQNPESEPEPIIITATEPCFISDLDIETNSTITIDCLLNLEGQTIEIPEGVTFAFDGGDIFNGTLNFSSAGKIAGELLNSNVEVMGDVQLTSTVFQFVPSRWKEDIVEGETSTDIALKNNTELENLFFWIKELRGTTFKIDAFDAYFEVTKVTSTTTNTNWYPSVEAINLPSDFNLVMTDNTHLRIFPGGNYNLEGGAILAIREASNVSITGGNLHGDRDTRFYSSDDVGLEGSHLVVINSGKNVTIDGVYFENGSKGVFAIQSIGFSFSDHYNPTESVIIKNCTFKDARRMSIALTDGRDIFIDGNTFIDNGLESTNSDGGEVGYAINIEPARTRDESGDLKEYQKVFDVTISNNKESGSRGGFLTATIGQDIRVFDNNIGTRVVYSLVSNTKIYNNTFEAKDWAVDSWAIFCAGSGETVFENEVYDNSINGYSAGIIVGSVGASVYNNVIDCGLGIQLSNPTDAKVYNNSITASGHPIAATNTTINNARIYENTLKANGSFNMYFVNVNKGDEEKDYIFEVENNIFESIKPVTISNTTGLAFSDNTVNGSVQVTNATNVTVSGNTIKPNESHGITLTNAHINVSILNNMIYEPTGADRFVCLNNESTTPIEVELVNNTCN